MKKKRTLVIVTALSAALSIGVAITAAELSNNSLAYAEDINNFWYHYAAVEPTLLKHGSKEFWANCSTHNFVLTEPAGTEEIKEGVAFDSTKYFDELDEDDPRYVARIDIDIKGHLQALISSLSQDPYSYIPETMRPDGVQKYSADSFDYNFEEEFVNVGNIHYGGFGEQWHMVIENIKESERFYSVTTYGSQIIGVVNLVLMEFLDNNENPVVTWSKDDTNYLAKFEFEDGVLDYTIQFKTSVNLPLFGTIIPQLDMNYVVETDTKTVRFQLGENAALKFVITPNSYTFALEYGIEQLSRKAYFTISKNEEETIEGHIYEFVQAAGHDVINSCADFYIDETYTSVVGNKASGIKVLQGYINELYTTNNGKLKGYEIRETRSLVTYNTLWFNMDNITGFNNVKAIEKESYKENENPHDVYVNDSASIFEPTYNTILGKKTSRKYDIELRTQYFYSETNNEITEHETNIPMMFIQAGDNFDDYHQNIYDKSGINSSVTLSNQYLTKIQDDYAELIDIFIAHKGDVSSDTIVDYIGSAKIINQ